VTELEKLLRRVVDGHKDIDIPALVDRIIEIVRNQDKHRNSAMKE
jgi:hypothetical protein